MQVPTKSFVTSKTFWLGVIEILVGAMTLLADEIRATLEAGEPISWILIAKGVLTIALRYYTTRPLTFSGKATKHVEP